MALEFEIRQRVRVHFSTFKLYFIHTRMTTTTATMSVLQNLYLWKGSSRISVLLLFMRLFFLIFTLFLQQLLKQQERKLKPSVRSK